MLVKAGERPRLVKAGERPRLKAVLQTRQGNLLRLLAASLLSAALIAEGIGLSESFAQSSRPASADSAFPDPPKISVNTGYPASAGHRIPVPKGGDLQQALNAARPGSTILLEQGATFAGNFRLPDVKAAGAENWVVIRTAAPDSAMPAGKRVEPSQAAAMPKLISPNAAPVLATEPGAHHFRLIGIELTVAPNVAAVNDLVMLGDGSNHQNKPGLVPHDLVIDRCYVHGSATANAKRGIALNSGATAIIESWISDFHCSGADSQAICGWNGPGPFKITGNYVEAAGENLMFGGADPSIEGLVPSDIEITRNEFTKPVEWKAARAAHSGPHWTVKNLLELKNACRVLIDGNIFENSWVDGQTGFAIVIKSVNQDGGAPWCVTRDVSFTNNIVRHAAGGISLLGRETGGTSLCTNRILIRNNLFEDIGGTAWGGVGRLFEIASGPAADGAPASRSSGPAAPGFAAVLSGPKDLRIDHNTAFQTQHIILASEYDSSSKRYGAAPGFVFTNNIVIHNQYGVFGDNGGGIGSPAIKNYFPGAVFKKNVLIGGQKSNYPDDNFFPAAIQDVGFSDRAHGDYALTPSSPFKKRGTDGLDIGCDTSELRQHQAGQLTAGKIE